ncbi:hypothetical protein GPECTOR_196g334 [Gonium pectorale]|uniref:Uncharacterized protein n=1 Tax=Gonium pectorale TaxID=33097 RepID=A0A150FX04_GONPE|nr:hypothetical protein GPECTOR_196g334 [Gonium pectorale]|eukprot:KXZ42142.1 hypothetical protein GPECTOR_196g334 [Gonium pectorale]
MPMLADLARVSRASSSSRFSRLSRPSGGAAGDASAAAAAGLAPRSGSVVSRRDPTVPYAGSGPSRLAMQERPPLPPSAVPVAVPSVARRMAPLPPGAASANTTGTVELVASLGVYGGMPVSLPLVDPLVGGGGGGGSAEAGPVDLAPAAPQQAGEPNKDPRGPAAAAEYL